MTAHSPHNHEFLAPRSRYYSRFSPQNLAFNANMQEFAMRVNTLSGLETGGKITPTEAYTEISKLWQQLADSYNQLSLQGNPFSE
ncbi:MAG: hypothetical protein AAGF98_19410 [Cyanobacteria bacterium P01_H01_bin.153]